MRSGPRVAPAPACSAARAARGAGRCLGATLVLGLAACHSLPQFRAPAPSTAATAAARAQFGRQDIDERVAALLGRMTLEEKIGQLTQYSGGQPTGPASSALSFEELIGQGRVGSMLNVYGAERINYYQRLAMQRSRLHIPLLFGLDVLHGYRTVFPVPLALASSWDGVLVEAAAHTAAREARADGIAWVFSPMVDIARDPRWGRIVESAGEDPYLGAAMARAWIRGYQQVDLGQPGAVAATVKHFAAYGAAIAGREYNATDMSDITLRQVYLPPYRAAVDAGAATVMSAFNSLNGVPASANPYLLKDILRKEWGFEGFVVSDWRSIAELRNHAVGPDTATVARKALLAGVDMDMEDGIYDATLAPLVRSGAVPMSRIDEAVARVLRVKFALGLFDQPYAPGPQAAEPAEQDRQQARAAAAETVVLLKNAALGQGSAALLPLPATLRSVALLGPLADAAADMLGSSPGVGDPRRTVTLRQALQERLGERLHYAQGVVTGTAMDTQTLQLARPADEDNGTPVLDADLDESHSIAEAVALAREAEVVILALGERADMTGEATSRTRLDLPGRQQRLLEAVAATGKPVVLVLFTGRPIVIKWAAAHIPAILEAWFPGIEGGHALGDVLFGDVDASGRLTAGFPRAVGQEPLYYAQLPTGRPAQADLSRLPANTDERYESRYVDEENAALFPFGWGLSYTRFEYSNLTVSQAQVGLAAASGAGAAVLRVGVDVHNAGERDGIDVVQLYLRNTSASVEQPVRELKGYSRISLARGQTRHLEFALGFDELSFYGSDGHRVVEPSSYQVFVGANSLAPLQTGFQIRAP